MAFHTLFEKIFMDISIELKKSNLEEECNRINQSGDVVKKIDLECEKIFVNHLKSNSLNIIGYVSEETEQLTFFDDYKTEPTKKTYIAAFDPLDGSSNYTSNINTGSIYGIYEYSVSENRLLDIVDSGYCLYGIKTIMVYTFENTVLMRDIYNRNIPVVIHFKNIKDKKKIYSINSSNDYNPEIRFLIQQYKIKNYSMRWVGTMVADAHRILMNDGIFYYPVTRTKPTGKIRMLYESIPFAYIFEKAGGVGLNENFRNITERVPSFDITNPHISSSIILASDVEYERLQTYLEMYEIYKF